MVLFFFFFFFSSRRRHTRSTRDWSSDVCSSDLGSITTRRACMRTSPSATSSSTATCGRDSRRRARRSSSRRRTRPSSSGGRSGDLGQDRRGGVGEEPVLQESARFAAELCEHRGARQALLLSAAFARGQRLLARGAAGRHKGRRQKVTPCSESGKRRSAPVLVLGVRDG